MSIGCGEEEVFEGVSVASIGLAYPPPMKTTVGMVLAAAASNTKRVALLHALLDDGQFAKRVSIEAVDAGLEEQEVGFESGTGRALVAPPQGRRHHPTRARARGHGRSRLCGTGSLWRSARTRSAHAVHRRRCWPCRRLVHVEIEHSHAVNFKGGDGMEGAHGEVVEHAIT